MCYGEFSVIDPRCHLASLHLYPMRRLAPEARAQHRGRIESESYRVFKDWRPASDAWAEAERWAERCTAC